MLARRLLAPDNDRDPLGKDRKSKWMELETLRRITRSVVDIFITRRIVLFFFATYSHYFWIIYELREKKPAEQFYSDRQLLIILPDCVHLAIFNASLELFIVHVSMYRFLSFHNIIRHRIIELYHQ